MSKGTDWIAQRRVTFAPTTGHSSTCGQCGGHGHMPPLEEDGPLEPCICVGGKVGPIFEPGDVVPAALVKLKGQKTLQGRVFIQRKDLEEAEA